MNLQKHRHEGGRSKGYLIIVITLSVILVGMAGFAIWSFMNYSEQKSNVDAKIDLAVAEAKREQAEVDEVKFEKERNALTKQFTGPEDYGRLTFNYPKSWSAFVENDASRGGTFEAYLHRDVIPPISSSQQYMLRVKIESKPYDTVIRSYERRVERGDLKSSTASFNGHTAARFDGSLSNDIRGAAIVFRLRDKTVTLQTDTDQYKPDFDALIKTVDFNQ